MASFWTWVRGIFEEGGLFSFKVKRQVLRQETVLAVGSACIQGVCVEPRVTRGCSFMSTLGVCRTVSGGSVEADGATFAGLYLGIVCVSTLP